MIVDSESAIRNLVVHYLAQQNCLLESAKDGQTALEKFKQFKPNVVILDINLSDISGYELCEKIRSYADVFILILTKRSGIADKREGFTKGADDYITKPFDLQELKYRIRAVLRRKRQVKILKKLPLAFDNMLIDPERREVKINDEMILLTALEFDLLYLIAARPGKVWSRNEIIQNIWDYDYIGDERIVDIHINHIRQKIVAAQYALTEQAFVPNSAYPKSLLGHFSAKRTKQTWTKVDRQKRTESFSFTEKRAQRGCNSRCIELSKADAPAWFHCFVEDIASNQNDYITIETVRGVGYRFVANSSPNLMRRYRDVFFQSWSLRDYKAE